MLHTPRGRTAVGAAATQPNCDTCLTSGPGTTRRPLTRPCVYVASVFLTRSLNPDNVSR